MTAIQSYSPAHANPIARLEQALGRLRPRLYEACRTPDAENLDDFIGSIRRAQHRGIELLLRKADFDVFFGSIDPRLLNHFHECGALVVENIKRDGSVRYTVKRPLLPKRDEERVVTIRLDLVAYPAALRVRRAE